MERKLPLERHRELLESTAEKRKGNKNREFTSLSSLKIDIPLEIYKEIKRQEDKEVT
ncbi:hypothetical protein [Lysinibacillus capsici]|uniref:hypothetical protein n=1 Tax=Lysinibacillus capsici TaxID=2115968 RepID=UPI001314F346|nr:hypothetical protein [Lysinibacillus capsici]